MIGYPKFDSLDWPGTHWWPRSTYSDQSMRNGAPPYDHVGQELRLAAVSGDLVAGQQASRLGLGRLAVLPDRVPVGDQQRGCS